jgi:hypothetical protein
MLYIEKEAGHEVKFIKRVNSMEEGANACFRRIYLDGHLGIFVEVMMSITNGFPMFFEDPKGRGRGGGLDSYG